MLRRRQSLLASLLPVLALSLCTYPPRLNAAECRLELVDGLPTELSPEIAAEINSKHIKLRLGEEDFCEIWLAKSWKSRAAESSVKSETVLYPLEAGALVGAIKLAHTCYDLRDQELPAGVYTLRYAIQPEIEAHKGTHDSRDFLLLVSPSVDNAPGLMADLDQLIGQSGEAIGTLHPAFLPLLRPEKPVESPSVRPDERDPDGWLLRIDGSDANGMTIPMEVILPLVSMGG